MRFFRTTRGRLGAFAIAILGAALLRADGGVLGSLALTERNETDSVLVSQAHVIAGGIEDQNGQLSFGPGELPGETQGGIAVDAAIVSPSGTVTQTSAKPLPAAVLTDLAAKADRSGGPVWADVTDVRGSPRRVYAIPLTVSGQKTAALVVSRSTSEQQATLPRTVVLTGLFSAAVLLVGGVLAYWLAGRVLRPVSVIASLARSISGRDLHRRVGVKGPYDRRGR